MEAVSPLAAPPVARRRRARPRRAGLVVLALCGAAAAGVQLVDGSGAPYAWDLDTPQPNVVAGKVTYYLDPRGTSDGVTGPPSAGWNRSSNRRPSSGLAAVTRMRSAWLATVTTPR